MTACSKQPTGLASAQPEGAHVFTVGQTGAAEPGETLTTMTWNIHYGCGPSLEVGRFASRDQVVRWLDAIAQTVRAHGVDVVALQEVDRGSVRTHDIDQLVWLEPSKRYTPPAASLFK
mgnify:CR=1 FL=1